VIILWLSAQAAVWPFEIAMQREMVFQRATETERPDLSTNKIKEWRSIVTLIVFVLTSKFAIVLTVTDS
jgi:hypothetical protein